MEKTYRILSVGAHPDDADTYCGGLLKKLAEAGWDVRLLSVTDGSSGTYHLDRSREELKLTRRSEAARSGHLLGGRYDVWDYTDGRLEVTLEAREHLIRYIRAYRPDVILTNRPNDYHADHRAVAQLVQDASFLLTVPRVCEDVPYLDDAPAILFWGDDFKKPYPHQADIIVPVSPAHEDFKVQLAACHECQYFDWMYFPHHMERLEWTRDQQLEHLSGRFHASSMRTCEALRPELEKRFGERAKEITRVECYEISEYSGDIPEDFMKIAQAIE